MEPTSLPSTNPVSPQSQAASVSRVRSSSVLNGERSATNVAAIKKLIAVTKLPTFGLAKNDTLDATRDALASAGIKINGQIWTLLTDEPSWEFIFSELLAAVSAAKKDMPVEKFRPKLRRQFEVSRKHVTHLLQVQMLIRALKSLIDSVIRKKGASSPGALTTEQSLGSSTIYKSFFGGVEDKGGDDYLLEGSTVNTVLEPFLYDIEGSAEAIALTAAKLKFAEEKLELDKPATPAVGAEGPTPAIAPPKSEPGKSTEKSSEFTPEQQKLQKLLNKFLATKFDVPPNQMEITKLDPLVRLAATCFVCDRMNVIFDRDVLHRALVFDDEATVTSHSLHLTGLPPFGSTTVEDVLSALTTNPTFKKIADCVPATKNCEVAAVVSYKNQKISSNISALENKPVNSYIEALLENSGTNSASPKSIALNETIVPLFVLKGVSEQATSSLQRLLSDGAMPAQGGSDNDSQGALGGVSPNPSSPNLTRGKSMKAAAPSVERRIVFADLIPDFKEAMRLAVASASDTALSSKALAHDKSGEEVAGTGVLAESVIVSDDEDVGAVENKKRTLPLSKSVKASTIQYFAKVPSLNQLVAPVDPSREGTSIAQVHFIVLGLKFSVTDWDFTPKPTGPTDEEIRRAAAAAEVERLSVEHEEEVQRRSNCDIEEEHRASLITEHQHLLDEAAAWAHHQAEVAEAEARKALSSAQQKRRVEAEEEEHKSQTEVAVEEARSVLNSAQQQRRHDAEVEVGQMEVAERAAQKALTKANERRRVEVEELHRKMALLEASESEARKVIRDDEIKSRKTLAVKAEAARKRVKEAKPPLVESACDTNDIEEHQVASEGTYFQRVQLTSSGRVTFRNVQLPLRPTFRVLKTEIESAIGMRLSFGFATYAFENSPPPKSQRTMSKSDAPSISTSNGSPSKFSSKITALLAMTHPKSNKINEASLSNNNNNKNNNESSPTVDTPSGSVLPVGLTKGPSSPSVHSPKALSHSTNHASQFYGSGGELKCRELSQGTMKIFLASETFERLVVCRPLFPSLLLLEQEYSSSLPILAGVNTSGPSNRSSSVPLTHNNESPKRSLTSLETRNPKLSGWLPAILNKPIWNDDKAILPRILSKNEELESPKASPTTKVRQANGPTVSILDGNEKSQKEEERSPSKEGSPRELSTSNNDPSWSASASPTQQLKLTPTQQKAMADRLSRDSVAHKKAQLARLDAQYWPTSKSPAKTLNPTQEAKVVQRLATLDSPKRSQTIERVAKELDESRFGTKKSIVVSSEQRDELTKHFYQDGIERHKKAISDATKKVTVEPKKYVQKKSPEEWAEWQQKMQKDIGKDIRQKDYYGGI